MAATKQVRFADGVQTIEVERPEGQTLQETLSSWDEFGKHMRSTNQCSEDTAADIDEVECWYRSHYGDDDDSDSSDDSDSNSDTSE
jgi:hypothetical protein